MATFFKIKKDGEIIAQACNPEMAAYIALSYNAEVNWNNKTTIWNPKKERRGWLYMTSKAVDELTEIIRERVNKYEEESHARTLQKYKKEKQESPHLTKFYDDMETMLGEPLKI